MTTQDIHNQQKCILILNTDTSSRFSMYKTSSKSKFIFILKGLIGVGSIVTSQVRIHVSKLAFKRLSSNMGV